MKNKFEYKAINGMVGEKLHINIPDNYYGKLSYLPEGDVKVTIPSRFINKDSGMINFKEFIDYMKESKLFVEYKRKD